MHRQDMPRHDLVENLVHKQHLAELSRHLDKLHSADIAICSRPCRSTSVFRMGPG